MKKRTVLGVYAPTPRLTFAGLFLLATALAVPVGGLLWLIEILWL